MSEISYLLKNASIVNEGTTTSGDLLIQSGRIEKFFSGGHGGSLDEEKQAVIDLEGLVLLPGVIDDQVHFREPGLTHKADLSSESRAAVAGGITSFMEMPNTLPPTTTQERLQEKFLLASEKSLANYSFYMGATNENLGELKACDPSLVCGIKVFMGASTGNLLVDDPIALEGIFREISLPIAVHCEDENSIKANMEKARKKYGENIPINMHPLIRSHDACETSSRRAISLAEKFESRLHLLHLSTASEIRLLQNEQLLRDKRITAEVCVHHLWFNMDDYNVRGAHIKWNPAIKFRSDQLALLEAVKEGYIDLIATDHAPHSLEEKLKSYPDCPSGAPMVQHSLPAMITLANKHNIRIERIVELMCHNPAICFGIKNRGFIREGYAADLVVIDPDKPFTVNRDDLHYKCGWSPLEGCRLDATVTHTFVNGALVYEHGRFNEQTKGQPLHFAR